MQKEYHGVVVPMITPFGKDLKPDVSAIEKICENCAKAGVSVLSLGTTGESPSVSTRDSREVVRIVSNSLNGRVKVYACLTGNSLIHIAQLLQDTSGANARLFLEAG
jgi:4-hydroxy-tetrahydrodipicolinate synthase